jgi:signal transduction histidine kinase
MAKTRKSVAKNSISTPAHQPSPVSQRESPAIQSCVTYTLRPDEFVVVSVSATTRDDMLRDVVGRPLPEIWPQVGAMLADLLNQVRESGLPAAMELPGQAGTSIPCTCVPVSDGEGTLSHLICTMMCATSPISSGEAEAEDVRRAAILDRLLDNLPVGVLWIDAELNVLYANKVQQAREGFQVGDRLPIGPEERHPNWRDAVTRAPVRWEDMPFIRTIRTGQSVEMIASIVTGTGEAEQLVKTHPFYDAQGNVTEVIMVGVDVTEMQRLDQMKEDFLNEASHELRAPLEPLILASRFIQRWIGQPDHERDVVRLAGEVATHARRISRLVAEMLDMTRITAGYFAVDPISCDLSRTILDAIEDQQTIWKREIMTKGLDRPLPCSVDPERIWQVMTNLLSNAIKYSSAPAPIEVEAEVIDADDARASRLRLIVRDHGCGIASEHLPHIFSRFYRIMQSRQNGKRRDGLGLGLYICHSIITAHNGHIWAESTVGQGSSFFVELPLSQIILP